VTRVGWILSVAGAVLLLIGPVGTRLGLWPFLVGFVVLGLSLLLGLAGASVSLVAGFKTGQWLPVVAGIVVGLAVVGVPSAAVLSARGAPPIHEITTDPGDPPAFVDILPLRAGAANPPGYGGADVAAQQRRAYPDIEPLVLELDAEQAYDRAVGVVQGMGLNVVARDRSSGRIEAVDTTFWFGFKDDIVLRLSGTGSGTRIDVRSKSRVGLGDLGTNARRVRELLRRLRSPA